jgi:hypothetical protein
MIPGLLAGLYKVLHNQTRNDHRGMFGGDVPIPLMIVCTEMATACLRDDVIIVNVRAVNSMWPVMVIERKM